jgi:hypothetical protein
VTRLLTRLLVAGSAACAMVLSGSPAGVSVAAADDAARIRVAHLSSDTPAVDVVVSAVGAEFTAEFPDADYGDVSSYVERPAGIYTVAVRRAGAALDTPAVLSTTVELSAEGARTVALSGSFADLGLQVVDDDLATPPEGHGRVRVLDGTSPDGRVDVRLPDGTELASGAASVGEPVTVPAGPTTVRIAGQGIPHTEMAVDVARGSVRTLLLLDSPDGGVRVRWILDAAGPAVVPTGGVAAGAGGMSRPVPSVALLGLLAVLSVTVATLRRGLHPRSVRSGWAGLAALAGVVMLAMPSAMPVAVPSPAPLRQPVVVLEPAGVATPVATPVRVRMPTLGVDVPLGAVRTRDDGTLAPPEGTTMAGWYADGPRPGEPGPAVLTGHVDSEQGPAAFFRLADLAPGDEVLVDRGDGSTARFTVTRVARHPKDGFPTEQVYAPTPDAQLRLITCGGDFDAESSSYVDNVVVFARLT